MGLKSTLCVNGVCEDNYKNSAEFREVCKRNKEGKFEPIHIECYYFAKYGIMNLKVYLEDFNKIFVFIMNEDPDDEDDVEFGYQIDLQFDLNKEVDKLNPLKDKDEVRVCIFTCWCSTKQYCPPPIRFPAW